MAIEYESFQEWNPEPEIAEAAEKLYGHIDNLELYVGLQAEQTKPVMDGAGLCPGTFDGRSASSLWINDSWQAIRSVVQFLATLLHSLVEIDTSIKTIPLII